MEREVVKGWGGETETETEVLLLTGAAWLLSHLFSQVMLSICVSLVSLF